jgi:hypothetical protein
VPNHALKFVSVPIAMIIRPSSACDSVALLLVVEDIISPEGLFLFPSPTDHLRQTVRTKNPVAVCVQLTSQPAQSMSLAKYSSQMVGFDGRLIRRAFDGRLMMRSSFDRGVCLWSFKPLPGL